MWIEEELRCWISLNWKDCVMTLVCVSWAKWNDETPIIWPWLVELRTCSVISDMGSFKHEMVCFKNMHLISVKITNTFLDAKNFHMLGSFLWRAFRLWDLDSAYEADTLFWLQAMFQCSDNTWNAEPYSKVTGSGAFVRKLSSCLPPQFVLKFQCH